MDLPFGACCLVLGIQWVARRLATRHNAAMTVGSVMWREVLASGGASEDRAY
jgi:hypothetical protein